jgi:Flp pilus assembly pilin Flp
MENSSMIKKFLYDESGQGMTEYILVTAIMAMVIAGVMAAWKLPLAKYLNSIAQAIAKTR